MSSPRLNRILRTVPVAAGAVGAAASAEAQITYFDVPDQTIGPTVTDTFQIGSINIATGAYDLTAEADTVFMHFQFAGSSQVEKPGIVNGSVGASSLQIARSSAGYGTSTPRLSYGTTIDASTGSSSWLSSGYLDVYIGPSGAWNLSDGTAAYVGLRIDQGSSNYNYGWAQLSYNDAANTVTLFDFAFEQGVNTAILAGAGATAVPEPATSVLLLAAGAGGVAAFRRRRVAKASAEG